ncbi:class I SAM-dependent methyltransferase [Thermoplasma sp.]|uniref:class I SAM-dependent methyltransferase n=1 Tax=Thermoplasma sp. TaxID=1973142 RepID=UPI0026221589|nr:class I SAM-dependent methyltransferase [Thermoplasma sp.]
MDEMIGYFDENVSKYDSWYDKHEREYHEQLEFIRERLPSGKGVEIGVGTGRFASQLGIPVGVDASEKMLSLAASRGIFPIMAYADRLPFISGYFDFSIFIVTICFLDDPVASLKEAGRISKEVISVILEAGTEYTNRLQQEKKGFYAYAKFYSEADMVRMYTMAGLKLIRNEYSDLYTGGMRYRIRYVAGINQR